MGSARVKGARPRGRMGCCMNSCRQLLAMRTARIRCWRSITGCYMVKNRYPPVGTALMVILPKCPRPTQPKQLRPICLGSSACKVYSRMLLARSKSSLRYSGPFQNMGAGRQTVDYVWVVSRLMALDHEWKSGLWYLKLGIAKASDSLHRGKFLARLNDKMGACEELRSWWALFQNTEATLATSWGDSTIKMSSGIRQGSVESPQVFATAMDWVVGDVAAKYGWDSCSDVLQGLEFAESAFVDDCILWNGSKDKLSERAAQLMEELLGWGLRVNPEKCQVYVSPHSNESGSLMVGGYAVAPDDTLDVMGILFKVGISPRDALKGIFQRTKGKFWAAKHLFRAKTSMAGRMKLMQRVLAGLWCAAAFVPDKGALHAINVLQAQLTIWALRLHRKDGEKCPEFKIRCYRSARYCISTHVTHRWSTTGLAVVFTRTTGA